MKKIALYLMLTLAAVVGFVPPVRTQVLNAITPALLQARAWTFTALQTFSGGVKTPLKIGTDYTLANPAVAPTGATSATSGTCTTGANSPYRFYTAWANLSGITNLSPASGDVAGTFLKGVRVTRSETVPSGATAWLVYWSGSLDAHAVKKLCLSGTADSLLVASGTSIYDCSCSSAGTAHGGTNQTGLKAKASIEVAADNVIGFGSVGTTIGSVTENVRRIRATGVNLEYSSDSGATYGVLGSDVIQRQVTVCAAGCDYTTLNAACATETSTAANPIEYRIGPGSYTGQVSCSGEDRAAFVGSGPGVTTLIATGVTGNDGTFKPGTSTNFTVSDMTISGHRAVHWDGASVGGGRVLFTNVEFVTEGIGAGFEDGFFADNLVAGTELRIEDYRLLTNEDGITIDDGGGNIDLLLKSGTHRCISSPTIGMRSIRFNSTPCRFAAQNLLIDCEMSPAGGLSMTGFEWNGGATGGCSANAYGVIQGTTVRLKHNGTTGGSSVIGVDVSAAASTLTDLRIMGSDITATAVSVNTNVLGVQTATTTTQTSVVGSRVRASGGTSNQDFKSTAAGGQMTMVGTDYVAADDTGRHRSTLKQTCITTAPATCTQGESYFDCQGSTMCLCTTTNVWTDLITGASPGGCV